MPETFIHGNLTFVGSLKLDFISDKQKWNPNYETFNSFN